MVQPVAEKGLKDSVLAINSSGKPLAGDAGGWDLEEKQSNTGVCGGDDELPGYIAKLLVLKRTAVVRSFSATLRAKPRPPSCTRGWKC